MISPSPALAALLSLLVMLCCVGPTACKKEEKVEPPQTNVIEEPKQVEPQGDPLEDAKMDATKHGDLTAIGRGDKARLVAANIESSQMQAQVRKPTTKSRRPEKHTGNLAAELISKEVRRYEGAMKACYERALKRSPGLKGKVQLTVVVDTDGSTKSARTRGISLQDDHVVRCMEGHAKKMRFPAPKGGSAQFNKVYAFKPEF